MVLFKDISKASTDLLTKDFVHEKPWDIELQHMAKNPLFIHTASVSPSYNVDAASSVKYLAKNGALEGKCATGACFLDATYKTSVPGLVLGARFDRKALTPTTMSGLGATGPVALGAPSAMKGSQTSEALDVSVDYLTAGATHWRFGVNPLLPQWNISATTSLNAGKNVTARLGYEATGSTDIRALTYSLGASLIQQSADLAWVGTIRTAPTSNGLFSKVIGNLHAKRLTPGSAELAAEVVHDLKESKSSISFGGLWYLDSNHNNVVNSAAGKPKYSTILRAKLSHDIKAAVSLSHAFSESLSATVGAQVDVSKPLNAAGTVQYGLKFNIAAA